MMTMTPVSPRTQSTPEERANSFLEKARHFQLGHLPTESRHPKTTRLSQLAKDDLPSAIRLFQTVELEALEKALPANLNFITEMSADIAETLKSGGRIFFCGCGATGRLSLSLETLWREEVARLNEPNRMESVVSFIAGADYALVRSIENFEDYPEYGARQLHDLGFTENDLLIGTSEGGETPFVIGAVEEAAKVSKRSPYFLFCNPADLLAKTVERSRRVIENPKIRTAALETGPMALAGSTRLQATTALMLAAGAALFPALDCNLTPQSLINDFINTLRATNFSALAPLIEREAEIYRRGEYCLHRTDRYGMTVLTDTTERSPTFSLLPFENTYETNANPSWTFLVHRDAVDARDSWLKILGREPRALDWPEFKEKFGATRLNGFDFSPKSIERRSKTVGPERLHIFDVESGTNFFTLKLDGKEARFARPEHLLNEHLLLKVALNISSTLTMGRLDRFSGNLMLYVRAANNKLVDRAIRYIRILLDDADIKRYSYDDICLELFRTVEGLQPDEPAVWRTFERLRDKSVIGPIHQH